MDCAVKQWHWEKRAQRCPCFAVMQRAVPMRSHQSDAAGMMLPVNGGCPKKKSHVPACDLLPTHWVGNVMPGSGVKGLRSELEEELATTSVATSPDTVALAPPGHTTFH